MKIYIFGWLMKINVVFILLCERVLRGRRRASERNVEKGETSPLSVFLKKRRKKKKEEEEEEMRREGEGGTERSVSKTTTDNTAPNRT
jgi:hypothetical protein